MGYGTRDDEPRAVAKRSGKPAADADSTTIAVRQPTHRGDAMSEWGDFRRKTVSGKPNRPASLR